MIVRRFKNKGNIIIDLTSMLDVIFIVLLVVMSMNQEQESKMRAVEEESRQQSISYNNAREQYEDQSDSIGNISEYIAFISINASFDEDLVTRHISVMNSDKKSEPPVIPELKRTKTAESFDTLTEYLEGCIQENPERVVVLSLNEGDEDILYRDEKEIKGIFYRLKAEHGDNVRIKGSV